MTAFRELKKLPELVIGRYNCKNIRSADDIVLMVNSKRKLKGILRQCSKGNKREKTTERKENASLK